MPISCRVGPVSLLACASAVNVPRVTFAKRISSRSACPPLARPRVLLTLYFGAG